MGGLTLKPKRERRATRHGPCSCCEWIRDFQAGKSGKVAVAG